MPNKWKCLTYKIERETFCTDTIHLHLLSFFYHVNRKSDHTVSRLCHGPSPIFEEFLSSSRENLIYHGFEGVKCFITYVYFILIMNSHVYILNQLFCQTNFAMLNILISCRPISSSDSASPGEKNACRLLTHAVVSTAHAQLHN